MRVKMNIGLNRRTTQELMSEKMAINIASKFFNILTVKKEMSNTEQTLVVYAETKQEISKNINRVLNAVHLISDDLDQDAIAVKIEDDNGFLSGDSWKDWGAFNQEYFLD